MAKVESIVIHCSDSYWGTAIVINGWHQEYGWTMIGYHDVVLNGYPTYDHWQKKIKDEMLDGSIECGRKLDTDGTLESDEYGAQVKGYNKKSIGICCITKDGTLTPKQKEALMKRVQYRMKQFGLGVHNVKGHYELDSKKTCPNFDMSTFRNQLLAYINKPEVEMEPVKPKKRFVNFNWDWLKFFKK